MRITRIFLLLVLFGISFLSKAQRGYPSHYFMAYIIQDGKMLPIDEHVVQVKRAPFQIVVDMPDRDGVFVNVSHSKSTYRAAVKNVEWEQLKGFGYPAIYEVWGNPLHEILLADNQPMFWFIDSKLHNRFTSYEYINNRYVCIREVAEIYDVNLHESISLKTVESPVYFTFIKFRTENKNLRDTELMRHEFKIEWIN